MEQHFATTTKNTNEDNKNKENNTKHRHKMRVSMTLCEYFVGNETRKCQFNNNGIWLQLKAHEIPNTTGKTWSLMSLVGIQK